MIVIIENKLVNQVLVITMKQSKSVNQVMMIIMIQTKKACEKGVDDRHDAK